MSSYKAGYITYCPVLPPAQTNCFQTLFLWTTFPVLVASRLKGTVRQCYCWHDIWTADVTCQHTQLREGSFNFLLWLNWLIHSVGGGKLMEELIEWSINNTPTKRFLEVKNINKVLTMRNILPRIPFHWLKVTQDDTKREGSMKWKVKSEYQTDPFH